MSIDNKDICFVFVLCPAMCDIVHFDLICMNIFPEDASGLLKYITIVKLVIYYTPQHPGIDHRLLIKKTYALK